MSDFLLFSISLAVTLLGLAGSYAAYHRRGAASGARGAAWSLVPMGFYLTGLTEFLSDLVFSPVKWAGVALLGVAGVLYVTSGVKLRAAKAAGDGQARVPKAGRREVPAPAKRQAPPVDDDMAEIEEILRRRGI